MAYTNIYLTNFAEDVSRIFQKGVRESAGLLRNMKHVIVPAGVSSKEVVIPGAVTSATRTAGSQYTAAAPTDTKVTLTPSTEYGTEIPLDRITVARSYFDIPEMYAQQAAGSIIDSLSAVAWALYSSITTNEVGVSGETPSVDILSEARQKLSTAKTWRDKPWVAVVGPEEVAAWAPALTWSTAGPAGQAAMREGVIGRIHGFDIVEDQGRKDLTSSVVNLAMHPDALAVAFRSEMPAPIGGKQAQYTDPDSGITIFVEMRDVDDATTGIGANLNIYCIAAVEDLYESFACQILG